MENIVYSAWVSNIVKKAVCSSKSDAYPYYASNNWIKKLNSCQIVFFNESVFVSTPPVTHPVSSGIQQS